MANDDRDIERELRLLGTGLRHSLAQREDLALRRERAIGEAVLRFQQEQQRRVRRWQLFSRQSLGWFAPGAVAVIGLMLVFHRGTPIIVAPSPTVVGDDAAFDDEIVSGLSSFSDDLAREFSLLGQSMPTEQIALSFEDVAIGFNDTTLEDVTDEFQES